MIPVEIEDPQWFKEFRCLEHCCFCAVPTPYWHKEKDVAVCQPCAAKYEPADVPTKDQWCKSPQARGVAPRSTK